MRGVRIPLSLVVRRRGAPALFGWLLTLVGATAAVVSLVKLEPVPLAWGLAAMGLGVWLLRRGIAKRFPAYGRRNGLK